MWLTIAILLIIILYLISYNADLTSKLEEYSDNESSKDAAWKLYERASSEAFYLRADNNSLKSENKSLRAFKEATEYIIENYTIVEANDKIKELVQSCKETDTNSNN